MAHKAQHRDYPAQVAQGVAMLDAHYGAQGWPPRIRRQALDLAARDTCILGQLEGDFRAGCQALGVDEADACAYGFDICNLVPDNDYSALHALWERVLIERGAA